MPEYNDIDTIVLNGFKEGVSIDSLAMTYYYNKKEHIKEITRKDARAAVEKIILEDYLKHFK